MMHQLLTGQARHHVYQVKMGVVLGDQAQRGTGGLELAVFVIDQQGFRSASAASIQASG